jgi:hypothetical protein
VVRTLRWAMCVVLGCGAGLEQRHPPQFRRKVVEWVRRYLPGEIAGTVAELGGAAAAFLLTGSYAAAAIAGTVGAVGGYYAVVYTNAVRWAWRGQRQSNRARRVIWANVLAWRSVVMEFGPAELVDSLLVRPAAYYLGPALFGSAVTGWIAAKVFSDLVFYTFTIFSYELFNGMLVHPKQPAEGNRDAIFASTAAHS